ncbi:MAG: TolC family protein [bacterium]
MRRAPALIVTFLAWSAALAAPAEDVVRVKLDDLLDRVRTENPAVDIARAELHKYQALFDRAYYAWAPRLKVDSVLVPLPERRLLRECVDPTSPIGEIIPCPGQDVQTDERITAETEIGILVRVNAKLTFPLYTFGKVESAQRAARAGMEVGEAAVDLARAKLDFLVKKAWYGAQLAGSALDILQDGRKKMREAKATIEAELAKETGRFTSNDLRKLIVEQAELEAGFLETEALSELAWESLRVAGGFAEGQKFELDSRDLEPVHVEARTPDAVLELASLTRPDLRMAEAAVRARAAQVDMARADYYPNVALVGIFGYAKGTTADDSPDPFANDNYNYLSWGAVLGAELSLDYFANRSAVDQAGAALLKSQAELATLRQKLRLEVVEEVGQLNRRFREVEVRELAMKAGKAWLVSNSLNFGLGLATTDDLLTSLVAYSKARLKYFEAIYQYNLSVARLSQTVGTELAVPAPPAAGE